MKKIIVFFAFCSLVSGLFAYDVFSQSVKNGNVKTATCTEYEISTKFGDYYRTPSGKVIIRFDAKGKEVEVSEYTAKDVLTEKNVKTFNSDGTVSEINCFDAEGKLIGKTVNSYKNGNLVDVSDYSSENNLKAKTILKYKDNVLVDESEYDGNGDLIQKIIYTTDTNGRVTKCIQYEAKGTKEGEEEITYNDKGDIESIVAWAAETGTTKQIFRYASNGLLNEITTYSDDGKIIRRLMIKYNADNNVGKISDYEVNEKFGTTVNELVYMAEYVYEY